VAIRRRKNFVEHPSCLPSFLSFPLFITIDDDYPMQADSANVIPSLRDRVRQSVASSFLSKHRMTLREFAIRELRLACKPKSRLSRLFRFRSAIQGGPDVTAPRNVMLDVPAPVARTIKGHARCPTRALIRHTSTYNDDSPAV